MLYNAPRQASIRCKSDCTLFSLDRSTFNNIVRDAAVKKQEKIQEVLKKIELLTTLDGAERLRLQDGLQEQRVREGDYVIRQGEKGEKFYMVEQGQLVATKLDANGNHSLINQARRGAAGLPVPARRLLRRNRLDEEHTQVGQCPR